ncbi:hypothetical protein [uncultured Faecalibaculum sp.]|uniref:hypothetical protein n=1 Tax=uncultured Faecalibaculum sp. TaxID=1729681 RepID=UPI0026184F9D|nr:hypothetical protein [uncultured Faecalibaculum sp.]
MSENRKFPYEVPEGAVMDYADGRFIVAIKDDCWNEEELALLKQEPFAVTLCWYHGIMPFILEGGPVDSSDVYFNVQESDFRDEILGLTQAPEMEIVLLNADNTIAWQKQKQLPDPFWNQLKTLLEQQAALQFMPGEYDVNVEGLMSACEPFELHRYEKAAVKF